MNSEVGPPPSARTISSLPVLSIGTVGIATLNSVFVARLVGPEGQASFASIVAFNSILALVLGFGTGTTLRLKGTAATVEDRSRYIGFSLAAAAVGSIASGAWCSLGTSPSASAPVIVLAGAHCALLILNSQVSEFNQLDSRIVLAVTSVLVSAAVTFVGLTPIVFVQNPGLVEILGVFVFGFLLQLLFQFRGWQYLFNGASRTGDVRSHIRLAVEGAPIVCNLVCIAVLQRGNRIFVPLVAGGHVAGLIAAVAVVVEVLRLVPNSVGQGIFLRVTGLGRFDRTALLVSAGGYSITLGIAGALLLWGDLLIGLLFGEQFVGASEYIVPLIVAELGLSLLVIVYRVCLGLGAGGLLARCFLGLTAVFAVALAIAVASSSVWGVLWVFAGGSHTAAAVAIAVSIQANRGRRRGRVS